MKRQSLAASLVLALLAVLGLAGPVPAGEQVPFKGSFEGDVTVRPLGPPLVMVDVEAAGEATHLGKFALNIPHVVNRATMIASGCYEFTAANGDMVHAKFSGAAILIAPGILYIEESATVMGGTGRFAGASGSFNVERLYDLGAGTTSGSIEGTISSPGR
jgi:hypothetical protein